MYNLFNVLNMIASDISDTEGVLQSAYSTYIGIVNIVMPVLISVVVSFGLVYGIIIGVQFAKAEEADARDKAKDRLINMVIGVVVTAVIISVVYVILASGWIKTLFTGKNIKTDVIPDASSRLL